MRIRKVLKDAGMGLAVTVILFLVIEVALRMLGVGDHLGRTGLARGFDPTAAYLVPITPLPGHWQTQIFDGERNETVIPAKSEATRVLLFGGSNTEGFSEDELQSALGGGAFPALGQGYEVINLGRSGYGSSRVAILFEQALEALQPDVVVIYTGHNEFVERGFELELEGAWSSPLLRRAADLARESRAFLVAVDLFEGARESPQGRPEAWAHEHGKFSGITYDETLQYYEVYEQNLRRMCSLADANGVRAVLCTVVYNRFSMPYQTAFPDSMSASDRERFEGLRSDARQLLPADLVAQLPSSNAERIHGHDWRLSTGVSEAEAAVLGALRSSSGPLLEQETLPPPNGTWDPKIPAFLSVMARFHARTLAPGDPERLAQAEENLKRALALCPDHPGVLFELALVEYTLRRDPALVRQRFEDAASFDRAPQTASQVTNQIVREVARDHPDTLLFDADELFTENVAEGLVGWEWMLDHCHLHNGARLVLLRELASAIKSRWP